MKFCPTLPGSRQCYKLFITYILRLHVKHFIPARRVPLLYSRDPTLPGRNFYDSYDVNLCEKKVNKYLCRISSFYISSHRRCSAKKVFSKSLQYSQENTCVGASLRTFKSAILLNRDSNIVVFL